MGGVMVGGVVSVVGVVGVVVVVVGERMEEEK